MKSFPNLGLLFHTQNREHGYEKGILSYTKCVHSLSFFCAHGSRVSIVVTDDVEMGTLWTTDFHLVAEQSIGRLLVETRQCSLDSEQMCISLEKKQACSGMRWSGKPSWHVELTSAHRLFQWQSSSPRTNRELVDQGLAWVTQGTEQQYRERERRE